PPGSITAKAGLNLTKSVELRPDECAVDDTCSASKTKEDGVCPTIQLDALNVITVPGNPAFKELARVGGLCETAHTRRGAGAGETIRFIDNRAVASSVASVSAIGAADFCANCICKQRQAVGRANVLHELRSEDRY